MPPRARLSLRALLAPLVITACAGTRSASTEPLASSLRTTSVSGTSPSFSESSQRQGELRLTKNCKDYSGLVGGFCMITESNNEWIPVGSKVVYSQALAGVTLNSDITVYPPGEGKSVVFGHVMLTLGTPAPQGQMRLTGGTGKFKNFQGLANMTNVGNKTWALVGTYSFGGEDEDRQD
jgi:hypothetical protein